MPLADTPAVLNLISTGAPGHGPVHLLLISAAELGFVWDGDATTSPSP